MWLFWGPILRQLPDRSIGAVVKDYYLTDQFAYLSIARNVSEGLPAFVEPFTSTGSSIYPSAYYWLLGRVAGATGTTVFGAWNLVGMLVTLGLLAMATGWALWALPGRRAWAIAPLALLLGTLQWYDDGHWSAQYGEHSVLWAPYGSLFSPGAEAFGLLVLGLCLIAVGAVLLAAGRRRLALAGIAGALLGLTLEAHTYVGMFSALALVLALATHEAIVRPDRRWTGALAGTMAVALVASGLAGGPGAVARLAVVLAIPLAYLAARRAWRRDLGVAALAFAGGALVVAAPLLVRIGIQVAEPGSFFYLRQQWAENRNLSLPPGQVLLQFLPLWLLAGATVVALSRRTRAPRETAWLAILAGLLGATALLTFNDAWGFHTEPYRFLPYGTLLTGVVALPWLWTALADGRGLGRARVAGAGVAVALAATVPTTLSFASDTSQLVFAFPPQEKKAYERITAVTGSQLTLYDRCFRPDLVKIAGGGRVVFMNIGLAIPDQFLQVQRLLTGVKAGRMPPRGLLARVGVRFLATNNHCDGLDPAALRSRFGDPVSIPLTDATALGAPADLTYEVYRVGPDLGASAGR